jgi:hypothetical protein
MASSTCKRSCRGYSVNNSSLVLLGQNEVEVGENRLPRWKAN